MRIAMTRKIPAVALETLESSGADVVVWPEQLPPSPEQLLEHVEGAAGILSTLNDKIDGSVLDKLPAVKVVSNFAVGYDNIDVDACTQRGIAVCITPDVLTDTTADFAFALLMSAARRVSESHQSIARGEWKTWEPLGYLGQDVYGATLGIVGMGRIGVAMAKRAAGFNMTIVYSDMYRNEAAESELGVEHVEFDDLLSRSDFVSVHTPLTPETRGLFSTEQFKKMKSSSILINTARGPVVDTDALVEALKSGEIWGAGLDVTDPEPIPADHPLLSIDRAVVCPHIASASEVTRSRMAKLAADNVLAVLNGTTPPRCLNPEVLTRD
ncbi:MAG: D-glycerate dehydrogenase [Sphaerobacteraceae bacterium]|nr:MAG: D-glycerate dehydrogenase [Sphaerobacteraceae bacterium]